ncbi:hypothetical protein [Anoxybacteroides amylolyticum]|uniref:Uncharacterized protein n=1 Tax=Anoxybacteroides amylolyticum TaxID=294699 RepID=A0A160F3Y3_9BACL|nr:hypothetical protein [Anoxybacillus amylolyticus]ANB60333.1 hypothetical protein GFC30_2363 [Anoxybacillus amylolyticus]
MSCVSNDDLFPRLFFAQSAVDLPITLSAAGTEVLRLDAFVTLSNDKVKLDSMVELSIASTNMTDTNITGVAYVLQRSTNGGAFVNIAQLDVETQITGAATVTVYPNLTWVDTPGVGTQIYRIIITGTPIAGVTFTAETRALNALVVPEA